MRIHPQCVDSALGRVDVQPDCGGFCHFYQRVSIASYASAGIARGGMSVCPSVCHTPVLYHKSRAVAGKPREAV